MKKYLLLLSVVIIGLSACRKSDVTAEQAAVDDAKIQAYIKANIVNPNFTKDPSGIYYSIKQGPITTPPTTRLFPTVASTVQVAYNGKLLNGTVFDSNPNIQLALSQTIKGWQLVIPKIAPTDRITFIVPSALAYGVAGSGAAIPSNAVLVFTVDLIGFYN